MTHHWLKHIRHHLLSSRGAMFGMDARVALLIASVLAATGGVTIMSKIARDRVATAERAVEVLKDGVVSYYETVDRDAMPPNIAALFSNDVVSEDVLATDPWGNAWNYNTASQSVQIEDVPVTVFYVVIHSRGKDATDDSVSISTPAEYSAWAPANDDIGVKFNTLEIEKKRVGIYRQQGQAIVDALNAYEAAQYLEAETLCGVGGTNPADARCTNGSHTYIQYNYYPESSLDAGSASYWSAIDDSLAAFTSGNLGDMQSLMSLIDLTSSYATDPWDRVLTYDSNLTDRDEAPFTASVEW